MRKWEGIDKTTGKDILTDGGATKFYVGSPNPKTLLGFRYRLLAYKKFCATLHFNGTFGHYLYNNTAATVVGIGNLGTRNIAKDLVGNEIRESSGQCTQRHQPGTSKKEII